MAATAAEAKRPKAVLPDPPKFKGDRNDWPSWKAEITTKLNIDGKAIGDQSVCFSYIFTRLEGLARQNTTPLVLRLSGSANASPDILLDFLDRLYGDPNATARAADRLHKLRQAEGQSFARFLPILEREFANAGASDWPDGARKPILLAALNDKMRTALAARGIPADFNDLVRVCWDISNDMDILSIRGTRLAKEKPLSKKDPTGDAMDWEPTRIGKARADWVPKETLDKRKENGACLRCGKMGHFVRKCPLGPAERPKARINKARLEEASDSDENEDEPVSENE